MLYSARVRRISSHHHLMARGFVLSSETKTSSHFIRTSISRVSSPIQLRTSPFSANHLPLNPSIASINRLLCSCSSRQHDPIDMSKYIEAFAKRMAMAGLKPHHRIALGVSGGPDSMALCVLAASWKTNGTNATGGQSSSFIDGLLAIIVDHGLRSESKDEANTVSHRVLDMGIRCEIASCEWPDGRPKKGHLQEAARDRRYQIFQNVCIQHQIGVLLIAHHADDQICQGGNQEWVEDPTNQSPLFARNRIRMALKRLSSSIFNSDLQAVILTCRRTRLYVDQSCCNLINQSVTIMNKGYAVIDIEILNPSKVEDIFLSKFVALVLQFISQRHRPVRGSALKLLLDYFRTFPCKTSFTAAGCYICPAPGSKGSKILVCCSVDSCLPLKTELFHKLSCEGQKHFMLREIEQIIADGKPYLDHLVPDASNVLFLDGTSSESVLVEARRINILSESTYRNILSLRRDETKKFRSKTEDVSNCELMHKVETLGSNLSSPTLQPGYIGYFMNRFLVKWELIEKISRDGYRCESCLVGHDKVAEVRHMVDADWLYLAKLSECHHMENSEVQRVLSVEKLEQVTGKINVCSDYAQISAQNALRLLKSIPVAARRGLPVLVNPQGQLLSIPSVGFKYCPCLAVSAVFMPRVPLGGGHSSFI
ncbi:uncharacterized protein LOC114318217 isoform X2 [Camellia sinensis]|uniref:uncharacterized protein LOC114288821 isoform X2 n=1 Tax=Camellia sinensis TaxID=4442 RepID=UPI00103656DA|nr:uncharacterized protein LOC114288821 isoform X2 [Camellia sinensis]XP_028120885.1 uncharacterized protein LOC114318217 isoform X2 [Camellia sinensis]